MRASAAASLAAGLLVLACRSERSSDPDTLRLRIGVPYELTTLDPHAEDRLGNFSVLLNVYEPLVAMDGEMKLRPALAVAWESPDPQTWIFRLRQGVKFHDGRPLRAADVAYSINRVVHGRDLELRTYLLDVADAVSLDETAVRIRTVRASRIFLNKIGQIPIIREGATVEELTMSPNGTGPYLLKTWQQGSSVHLVRNPSYWGPRPPAAEAEILVGLPTAAPLRNPGLEGFDLLLGDSRELERALPVSGTYRVVRSDNMFVKYLAFDVARAATPFSDAPRNPFRNRMVREAIHRAIDRNRLVSRLPNAASPAGQPVPRFVFGFDPSIAVPEPDLALARDLLARAGYADGFRVVLHARTVLAGAAISVRDELAPLGIRVDVNTVPDIEFFDLMDRHEASLWINRYACSSGDASDIVDDVLHSTDRARHLGTKNYGGYSDPVLDAAIEKSASVDQVDDRRTALQLILRKAMEDVVVVPLYNDQDVYAVRSHLGWRPRADGYVLVSEIRADGAAGR